MNNTIHIYNDDNFDDLSFELVGSEEEDESKFHEITATIIDDYGNELRYSKELKKPQAIKRTSPSSNQMRLLNKFIGIFGNKKESQHFFENKPILNEYEKDVKKFVIHTEGYIRKKILQVENPSDPSEVINVQEEIVLDLNRTPLFIEDVQFTNPYAEGRKNIGQEIFDSLFELKKILGDQGFLNTSYFFHQGLAPKYIEEYSDQNELRIQKRMEKEKIFELPLSGEMKYLQVNIINSDTFPKAKFTIHFIYTIRELNMNENGSEPQVRGYISVQYEVTVPIEELNRNFENEKNIYKVMPGLEVSKYVSQEHANMHDAQKEVNGQLLKRKISEAFPFDKIFKKNQKGIIQQLLSVNGKFVHDNTWSPILVDDKEVLLQEIFLEELKNVSQAPILFSSEESRQEDYFSSTLKILYNQFGEQGLKNISCLLHRGIVPNVISTYPETKDGSQIFLSDNHFEFKIEELENFSIIKITVNFDYKLKKFSNKSLMPEDLGFIAGERVLLIPRNELEKDWSNMLDNEVAPNSIVVDNFSHLTPNLNAAKSFINGKSTQLNGLIESVQFSDF